MSLSVRSALAAVVSLLLAGCAAAGRGTAASAGAAVLPPASFTSAPIADVRYEVAFDSASAAERQLRVSMRFTTAGDAPVVLSLPAWTPGAYELTYFARWASGFTAEGGDGRPLAWDKLDADTWRVRPGGAGEVRVRFDVTADSLDNAMAWARPDFAFFNGTNVFLYPEGQPADFAATVTVRTQPGWLVATGMHAAGAPHTYREASYHDLVDMPVFVGRMDVDSMAIAGKTMRLATYPQGAVAGAARQAFWRHQQQMWPPMIAVFGELPVDDYTTMVVVDPAAGGSALEHQSSHVGIYPPELLGDVAFPSITAHEIFHLWNVKRLRPAELWPYDYARWQPTTLLWVSEGITDYYADLALVRGGIVDSATFLLLTQGKMTEVASQPPVALEDASLTTWVHPVENAYVYYPKGSLAGLLLDILIRDASDNAGSLDTVLRDLYARFYAQGRGFTDADFWAAASRAAGGRSFAEEYRRYVDGREPFPWDAALPLAGLRLATDTLRVPTLGVFSAADSLGTRIAQLVPGGVAERAGVRVDDYLVSLGEVRTEAGQDFGAEFRERYAGRPGAALPIVVRRGGRTLTLDARVEVSTQVAQRITFDRSAGAKAARVRSGILTGR